MGAENRAIVHLDLDTFFVSVERLLDSSLIGQPVLIGGTSDRGVVASCSYEARKFGIHSAMPMLKARKLCPDAKIVRGSMSLYSKYSKLVTAIIATEAPVFEKASIDEHYLDISGIDKYFGAYKWSAELRIQIIKETGLPISFGISINKTIAKIATGEAKPNGILHIPNEKIQGFLDPLSIRKIPMVGKKAFEVLQSMGILSIQDLRQTPKETLEKILGKQGIIIWEKANGIDNSKVKPYMERKSISTERTFETDKSDVSWLHQKLITMVEKLAFQLRKKNKFASVITIKVRYSNFETHTQQKQIPYTSFDHVLIKETLELFNKTYKSKSPLRLIGVKVSGLVDGTQQLNLFEDAAEMKNLYKAMDKVKLRYGEEYVKRAIGIKTSEEQKDDKDDILLLKENK